jgi:ribosomal protein S18 acetylase RimI-like enzyme
VQSRLLDSALIGFVVVDDKVVACAAVKKPTDSRADSVFQKAHSNYEYEDFQFELGYLVVATPFRHMGFASLLISGLCRRFQSHNLYATVRVDNYPAQSIVISNGFEQSGEVFRNRTNTEDLRLFIRIGTPNPNHDDPNDKQRKCH